MEFIENNYVWLIVIGVILLMTIIGYFADKAEKRGPVVKAAKPKEMKEKKSKKKKEKKNQIMESVPEVEEEQVSEELPPEWDENKKPVEEKKDVMNIEGTANIDDWSVLPVVPEVDESNNNISTENDESLNENSVDFGNATNSEENESTTDETNDDKETSDDAENNDSTKVLDESENNETDIEKSNESKTEELNESESNDENKTDYNLLDNDTELENNSEEIGTSDDSIPEENSELNNLEITLPNIETLNEENKDNDDEDVWKF